MRRRFFVERFENDAAVMRGETAEHLGRVLRAEPGQLYELSDGEKIRLARIADVSLSKRGENQITFTLLEEIEAREPRLALHLLISIVKFDRFEWCLEKATELGIVEIVPLAAAHSDKPLIAAAEKRRERWQKILVESAQQSRRLKPPVLSPVTKVAKSFQDSRAAFKIMLSERPDAPHLRDVVPMGANLSDAALAIGSEGGWTEEEFEAARSAGFKEASLGENILRTETAVIAGIAALRYSLG